MVTCGGSTVTGGVTVCSGVDAVVGVVTEKVTSVAVDGIGGGDMGAQLSSVGSCKDGPWSFLTGVFGCCCSFCCFSCSF